MRQFFYVASTKKHLVEGEATATRPSNCKPDRLCPVEKAYNAYALKQPWFIVLIA